MSLSQIAPPLARQVLRWMLPLVLPVLAAVAGA